MTMKTYCCEGSRPARRKFAFFAKIRRQHFPFSCNSCHSLHNFTYFQLKNASETVFSGVFSFKVGVKAKFRAGFLRFLNFVATQPKNNKISSDMQHLPTLPYTLATTQPKINTSLHPTRRACTYKNCTRPRRVQFPHISYRSYIFNIN